MNTKKLTKLAILIAVSVVLVALIHFSIIPAVPFLEYDPADVPILLGTFAMGPAAGLLLTILTSVIQGITVSAAGGWYGIVMHILATGSFVVVAGLFYKKEKTKIRAIMALVFGSISMSLIMIPANLILTPLYLGVERAVVKEILFWIILFNVIKAGINSLITFLLYKRVSGVLHK